MGIGMGIGMGMRRRGWQVGIGRRWALQALAACALLALVAGCTPAQTKPAPTSGPPTVDKVLSRPPQLAAYHIFVTDLLTGDVAELGVRTWHVARSVHGLGLSSDGSMLYVSDIAGGRIDAYALAAGNLSGGHSAPVGNQPVHMVNTPDGRLIFVTNFEGQSISVVDAASWTLKTTIDVAPRPHSIVLSPDGRYAYAACYGGAAVAVIDTASARLAATIALPAHAEPYGLAISHDGRYLYTGDALTGRLYVMDAVKRRVVGSVVVGLRPALIALSPSGKTLYVANGGSRNVSVVDLGGDPARPAVKTALGVQGYPHGLAVTPDGRYVVVANTYGNTISVIDAGNNTVIATLPGERYPNDVLITR
jgi:YVTN family beta-propeller protein